MGELVTLRKIGPGQIYQCQFQKKLAKADELIPKHLHMGVFIAKSDNSNKLGVQLLKPPIDGYECSYGFRIKPMTAKSK